MRKFHAFSLSAIVMLSSAFGGVAAAGTGANTESVESSMRIPHIVPGAMTPAQQALYDDIAANQPPNFDAFKTRGDDGAWLGPLNIWLTEPEIGRRIWELAFNANKASKLPPKVREVAIVTVGARLNSAYEVYAHAAIGSRLGLTDRQLSAISAGTRPEGLNDQESAAYDIAAAMLNPGPLPEPIYRRGVELFGDAGMLDMVYLVGLYAFVSTTLNAYDVQAPK